MVRLGWVRVFGPWWGLRWRGGSGCSECDGGPARRGEWALGLWRGGLVSAVGVGDRGGDQVDVVLVEVAEVLAQVYGDGVVADAGGDA